MNKLELPTGFVQEYEPEAIDEMPGLQHESRLDDQVQRVDRRFQVWQCQSILPGGVLKMREEDYGQIIALLVTVSIHLPGEAF